MRNKDLNKIIRPNDYELLPNSLNEININSLNSKNKIRCNSFDKIDKRKSLSNILLISQDKLLYF